MANDFQFDVGVDTRAAIKAIESFSAATSKSLASVERAFSAVTAVAIAAVAVVTGGALVKGLEEATSAAKESEDAFTKLQVALKLSGDFSQAASDDMQKFAVSLENSTAVSRNVILAQIAQAKAFGLSNEEAKRLVKVATDLSAVTGDSLDSSVGKLTKSLGGQLGKLDDLGTSFKDLSKIQLLSGGAVDLVEKKFSGAAQAIASTFGGATQQASNKFQALLSTVGSFITQNPAVLAAIRGFSSALSGLQGFIEANRGTISSFVTSVVSGFTAMLPKVVSLVRGLIRAFEPIYEVLQTISSVILDAVGSFLKLRVVQVVVNAIAKLILLAAEGVTLLASKVNDLVAAFLELSPVRFALSAVAQVVGIVVNAFAEFLSLILRIPGASKALSLIGVSAEELSEGLFKVSESATKAAESFDSVNVAATLKEGSAGLTTIAEKLGEVRESVDFAPALNKVGAVVTEVGKSASTAAKNSKSSFASLDATLAGVESTLDGVSTNVEKAGAAGATAGNKIADSMQNASDKGIKFTGVLKEIVTKALEAFSQTISISVDVAKADRDLQEFKARIPSILSNFEAEGQKVIKGLEAKVSAQLDLVRLAADEEGKKKLANITTEQAKKLKAIEQASKTQLASDLAAKEADYKNGLITLDQLNAAKVQIETESAKKLADESLQLNLDTEKQIQDQKIQNAKDIEEAVSAKRKQLEAEIAAARIKLEEDVAKKRFELQEELDKRILENAKKAEEAAARGAGQLIGAVTEYLVPGIGQVVGQIVTGLAQGGEFLAKGLQNIIDALPTIFDNLFKALPQIIVTLVEGVPDIIFAFINGIVNNIGPIITALSSVMPKAAIAFARGLIENAPNIAFQLVKGIVEGIINSFIELLNLIPFVDIPPVKLARGGEVPNGFMSDNFPASLTSGELVVDRSTTGELQRFLADQKQGTSSGIDADRLERILTRSTEKNLSIVIKVGERDLAETLVSLNRQGFRTA